ncbi:MAG: aminoglycoside phosphotransferase family protein [Clostridiaceae bacterium]
MHIKEENLNATTNTVFKVGDTVRRTVKCDPILHVYLQYLEKAGMPGVPRFLGLDEQGREILSYLPGKTQEKDKLIGHPCMLSDDTLADVARLMRKLHDLSVGFLPMALEVGWGNPDYPQNEPETICHNDAASWNFVFVNDRIAGLFDFDTACPGTRMWDLTLPVFSFIPTTPYQFNPEQCIGVPYERVRHAAERKRRLKLFFEAYGMNCSKDFLELLVFRMQDFCKHSKGPGLEWYTKVVNHIKETGYEWI